MKILICPTCGCSLVRLGISEDKAAPYSYKGEERRFCCQKCVDLFVTDPEKYLQRTSDVVVCPTCLGEKPLARATTLKHAGQEVHFCGCPGCMEAFQKDPEYYIKHLQGWLPQEAIPGHDGGSVKPA